MATAQIWLCSASRRIKMKANPHLIPVCPHSESGMAPLCLLPLYQVAQKCHSYRIKCNFSTTNREFYQHLRIHSGRSFQRSLKISPKYFDCFKNNYSFYDILFRISKLRRKNGQSLVNNVQRRSALPPLRDLS